MFETPGVNMITGGVLKASLGHFKGSHFEKSNNKSEIVYWEGATTILIVMSGQKEKKLKTAKTKRRNAKKTKRQKSL